MSRKKSKERCASCIAWQPGNSWISNVSGVYTDGTCEKTGKCCANVHHACKFYEKDLLRGVIIQVDIENFVKSINQHTEQ